MTTTNQNAKTHTTHDPKFIDPSDLQVGDVATTWNPVSGTVQSGIVEELETVEGRTFVLFKHDIDHTPEPWDDTAKDAVWVLIQRPQ